MSILSRPYFHDETAALEHVESDPVAAGSGLPSVRLHGTRLRCTASVRKLPRRTRKASSGTASTSAARAASSSPFAWARSSRKATCRCTSGFRPST